MNKFSILEEITALDGKRDELALILQDAEILLLKNDLGCQVYSVNISEEHPNKVFVYETWDDEKCHENSLQNNEVLSLIMKAKPIISNMKRHFTFTSISKR